MSHINSVATGQASGGAAVGSAQHRCFPNVARESDPRKDLAGQLACLRPGGASNAATATGMLATYLFGSRKPVVVPRNVSLIYSRQTLSSVCVLSMLKGLSSMGSYQSAGVAGVQRFGVVHLPGAGLCTSPAVGAARTCSGYEPARTASSLGAFTAGIHSDCTKDVLLIEISFSVFDLNNQ